MKHYLEPVVETIDLQSVDFLMQLAGSGEHETTTPAPKREKEKTVF